MPKTNAVPIWIKQIVLHPNSTAASRDVLSQLRSMVLRGEPENCFQVNRSEMEALLSGIVPDGIHVLVGTSRNTNGPLVAEKVWSQFSSRIFNDVRVACTTCPSTQGTCASFSDYATLAVQDHSINKAEILLTSDRVGSESPDGLAVMHGDEQAHAPEPAAGPASDEKSSPPAR